MTELRGEQHPESKQTDKHNSHGVIQLILVIRASISCVTDLCGLRCIINRGLHLKLKKPTKITFRAEFSWGF